MEELNKILKVSNSELDSLSTEFIKNYDFGHNTSYFHGNSGSEHYRLLMYVSTIYSRKKIYDVGTNRCMSAAALSFSNKNFIVSYDVNKVLGFNPILPYVEYNIGIVTDERDLNETPFIFLDVYHDGVYENIFKNHLEKIGWKGILMLDDIHLNDPMKKFWESFEEEKYDISSIGHWSGTGIVVYK